MDDIILIIGTAGLMTWSYFLGRIHGIKKARKATTSIIRSLPLQTKMGLN